MNDRRAREIFVDDKVWDSVRLRAHAFCNGLGSGKTCATDDEVNRVVNAALHCFLRAGAHEVRDCMFRAEHGVWRC